MQNPFPVHHSPYVRNKKIKHTDLCYFHMQLTWLDWSRSRSRSFWSRSHNSLFMTWGKRWAWAKGSVRSHPGSSASLRSWARTQAPQMWRLGRIKNSLRTQTACWTCNGRVVELNVNIDSYNYQHETVGDVDTDRAVGGLVCLNTIIFMLCQRTPSVVDHHRPHRLSSVYRSAPSRRNCSFRYPE